MSYLGTRKAGPCGPAFPTYANANQQRELCREFLLAQQSTS